METNWDFGPRGRVRGKGGVRGRIVREGWGRQSIKGDGHKAQSLKTQVILQNLYNPIHKTLDMHSS